jgi:hypothetical protein
MRKALANLWNATLDELTIIYSIYQMPPTERFTGEILRGAHVRILDHGLHYDDWKALPSARDRHSSHPSDGPQYHIDGLFVHTVLFGKVDNWSWFQLEGHPQGIRHAIDFLAYVFTHENQGPYGSSRHTHHRPIEIIRHQRPPRVIQTQWTFN